MEAGPAARTHAGRRAVILVPNAAAPYSRGLRVARSLAERGFDVEIAAIATEGLPREERDGEIVIRRYGTASREPAPPRGPRGPRRSPPTGTRRPLWRRLGSVVLARGRAARRAIHRLHRTWRWPAHDLHWQAALGAELEAADLYHACGYRAIPIALRLAGAARARGRAGRVVYDVIDAVLDSNIYSDRTRPVRALFRHRERSWARASDAVITVNDALARHVAGLWGLARRPVALLNCPPRWDPPASRPDLLRGATGIPPERAVVLHIGRLVEQKGLDETGEAALRLPDAALVLIGWGPLAEQYRQRSRDPRFAGRHFLLPPVHPDALAEWTASADVSVVAMPPNSLNQRLATPNKFWESLTAGTPIVVERGLRVMSDLVEREQVGAVADATDPVDLARALSQILDGPESLDAMRRRCLELGQTRYNWETAVTPYLDLVESLMR